MRGTKRTTGRGRRAFTLIELIVVIAIVGLLVALTAGAVFRVMAGQAAKNSEQTVSKISSILDQQWKAVVDQAKDDKGYVGTDLLAAAGGDNVRAQVLWVKCWLKIEFPQNFSEARSGMTVTSGGTPIRTINKPTYVSYLGNANSDPNPQNEAAVCLYMALSQSRRGMTTNLEEAVGASGIKTLTVGGKDFKVFADRWGTPISFVRWPRGCDELNAPPYLAAGNTRPDPQDPEGKLIGFSNPTYEQFLHPFNPPRYLTPVVMSAGQDRTWDVDFWLTPTGPGANDNIYSFRLRRSGQRGD